MLLEEYPDLIDTLKHLEQHPFITSQNMQFDYNDCTDVCNKLSYLLPASNQMKQSLLEIDSLAQRMQMLRTAIAQLQA
jgi:Lon protease-like protein